MTIDLSSLRDVNWKTTSTLGINVLKDVKVLGALGCLLFIFWGIGWDTLINPTIKELSDREQALKTQKGAIEEAQKTQGQHRAWQEELKGLTTTMIRIDPGQSSKVASVSASAKIVEMARNLNANSSPDEALPEPHNKLENVSIKAVGSSTINLLAPGAAAPTAPAPGPEPAMETPGSGGGSLPTTTPVNVEKFDYEMSLQGTYAALASFLNKLTANEHLVVINSIQLTKPADEADPDPEKMPDFPIKLNMDLRFSLYLYEAAE